jgi:hypothetical protein
MRLKADQRLPAGGAPGDLPPELLNMINGRAVPTKAVVVGLGKELDTTVGYMTELANEISKGVGETKA